MTDDSRDPYHSGPEFNALFDAIIAGQPTADVPAGWIGAVAMTTSPHYRDCPDDHVDCEECRAAFAAVDRALGAVLALGRRAKHAGAAPEGRTEAPEESESAPGTYWERAALERFVLGGPVDLATIRQQVAALLAETPCRDAPDPTEETR